MRIQHKLEFTDRTLTDADIYGEVKYITDINNNEDFCVGTVASAEVSFETELLDSSTIGKKFNYYIKQYSDTNWKKIGVFTIAEAKKKRNVRFTIKAYDNIKKYDTNVADYLKTMREMNIKNFFSAFVGHFGDTFDRAAFANDTSLFNPATVAGTNINGRTVLR